MLPLFTQPRPDQTWPYLPLVLVLGFGLRVLVGVTAEAYVHPDQHFQYLEQGYRLVYGYGVIPWEYVYGIRSWLIPMGIGGVIWVTEALGIGHPSVYIPAIEVTFCALSLTLILGIYRLAQLVADERTAIAALLISAVWPYFVHYAHVTLPTMLGATSLVWVAVLMLREASFWRLVLLGALGMLTIALRFQLLPAAGLMGLMCLVALRGRSGPMLGGAFMVLLLVGLLDWATWGGFLSSFIDN